jgi:hypothetical protein
MNYEQLVRLIHDAPVTQLPALIGEVMKAGYEKKAWREGKCYEWVGRLERRYLKERGRVAVSNRREDRKDSNR